MARLTDVAQEAGVSLATASRALNGSRDRQVRPELRERVLAAATRLNYSPHAAAQAMARGRSDAIGLIIGDITDPYFTGVSAGVSHAVQPSGGVVTLASTGGDHARRITLINLMRSQRARAIILAGALPVDEAELAELDAALAAYAELGQVALISQPGLTHHTVHPDNGGGAEALARGLNERGYTRAAIIAGPPTHQTATERAEGFARAWQGELRIHPCSFDRAGAGQAMVELMKHRPEVVFAVTDVMALGALAAARDAGVQVPNDVALAGFGDIPTLADVRPQLTTVRLPLEEIGATAVELALGGGEPQTLEIDVIVQWRESTPDLTKGL